MFSRLTSPRAGSAAIGFGAVVACVLALVSGCAGADRGPSGGVPDAPAGGTSSATVGESSSAAPQASTPDDHGLSSGPLLVHPRSCQTFETEQECVENTEDDSETFSAAEVYGEISIHDSCVFLNHEGRDQVAIFPYGTHWNDADQTITLPNGDTVREGDAVIGMGGYFHGGSGRVARMDAYFGSTLNAAIQRCLAVPGVSEEYGEFTWGGDVTAASGRAG